MMEAERELAAIDDHATTCEPLTTSEPATTSQSLADTALIPRHMLDPQVWRRLTRQLGVDVVVDRTGWLRSGVELVFTRHTDGRLQPERFRVGPDASEEDVRAETRHMLLHVARYNAVLHRLRQLAAQLADALRWQSVASTPNVSIADAHRQLAQLDQLIARRQSVTMVRGILGSIVLVAETEFLMRCEAQLSPVAIVAMRKPNNRPPWAFASLRHRLRKWFGDDLRGVAQSKGPMCEGGCREDHHNDLQYHDGEDDDEDAPR